MIYQINSEPMSAYPGGPFPVIVAVSLVTLLAVFLTYNSTGRGGLLQRRLWMGFLAIGSTFVWASIFYPSIPELPLFVILVVLAVLIPLFSKIEKWMN